MQDHDRFGACWLPVCILLVIQAYAPVYLSARGDGKGAGAGQNCIEGRGSLCWVGKTEEGAEPLVASVSLYLFALLCSRIDRLYAGVVFEFGAVFVETFEEGVLA